MAVNAFDGQYIATLKNRHPWVEYAVYTQPKPISGRNKPNPTQPKITNQMNKSKEN